jgi:3-deoxy-D-arabino-heptulosonate 7-phosphate (DAHP) synthase
MGADSLDILLEETLPHGLVPATEILSAEQARQVVDALHRFGRHGKILVWIGARNQNHLEQRNIARVLAAGPKSVTLMFKNQMWMDERHWIGICEHIVDAGFPKERLLACHRGFAPGSMQNPEGLRNLPDYEMAMRLKEKMRLPMLLDPSHIGGSRQNVLKVLLEAQKYDFDGYLVEVHHQPESAKTDIHQQLSEGEFQQVLKIIKRER